MLRTTDALRATIEGNPLLTFGLTHRLFNLTRLSKYLQPLLTVRTKKDVSESAIAMALSRLQGQGITHRDRAEYFLKTIALSTGWQTFTYGVSREVRRALAKLHLMLLAQKANFTVTQGPGQITLFVEGEHAELVERAIPCATLYRHRDLAAIAISFAERYITVPGLLALILEQVALQNVNVIEITSTFTEFTIFVAQEDAKLAFETLTTLLPR